MSLAKMTSKGQLTIPKYIRDYLDLHAGDKVEFIIDEKGQVLMTPKTIDIEDIFGMIKQNKHVSVTDMKKGIAARMKKRQSLLSLN